VVEEDGLILRLSFDASCVLDHRTDYKNVLALFVLAETTFVARDELARFILDLDWRHEGEGPLQDEYLRVGQAIYKLTLATFNRLIDYVRTAHDQYWLSPYPIDPGRLSSDMVSFDAQVSSDQQNWVRWHPTHVIAMTASIGDEQRYVRPEHWSAVRAFVQSEHSTKLTDEILAGAELLGALGYSRSSITEAVSALEVAVSRFFRSPVPDKLIPAAEAGRLNLNSLRGAYERLGLTVTVGVLLPLLVPRDRVPDDVFRTCAEAVAVRQTVIHGGQREVTSVNRYVRAFSVSDAHRIDG
jgi:hypothetical protein